MVAAPDARVWGRSAQFGVPFNVSLVGATTHLVPTAFVMTRAISSGCACRGCAELDDPVCAEARAQHAQSHLTSVRIFPPVSPHCNEGFGSEDG